MEKASKFVRAAAGIGILGIAIAAGGCAHTKEIVVSQPKDVMIGVPQKCIDSKDVPAVPSFPLDEVDLTDNKTELARVVNAATLERKVRREYVGKVQEVISKCTR